MGFAATTIFARLSRDERGISLIEVMMTAAILSVILGAILSLSSTTVRLAPKDDERAHQMNDARAGLYRMTSELREAREPLPSTGDSVRARTETGADVTWTCGVPHPSISGRFRCTRGTTGGTAVPVIDHMTNGGSSSPVFSRSPDGRYVAATVRVAAAGDRNDGHRHTITFEDAFFMRNVP